ncbi:tlde1 domain-containing protein [Pseudomonas sp. S1_E04]
MWIYFQDTGELYNTRDPLTTPRFKGYSGVEPYKNEPESQCFQDLGPIPVGLYSMTGVKGAPTEYSIILEPAPSNNMCGRKNFLIHGDSLTFPGWASEGCIIITGANNRKLIWESADRMLEVRKTRTIA